MMVAMMTPNSFGNMLVSLVNCSIAYCSSRLVFCDLQGVAIDRMNEQHLSGIKRTLALDLRIPEGVTVNHPRHALLLAYPGIQRHRLADVQVRHMLLHVGL